MRPDAKLPVNGQNMKIDLEAFSDTGSKSYLLRYSSGGWPPLPYCSLGCEETLGNEPRPSGAGAQSTGISQMSL